MADVDNSMSLPNEIIPDDRCLIFFDLETTGLSSSSEIIRISAKHGPTEFDAYILPSHEIHPAASSINGLTVENGELHLNGHQLATIPRRVAMQRFLDFLRPGPTILVAHNGQRFDAPKLLKEVQSLGLMIEFQKIVCGFCDSLPVLKEKLPERVKSKQSFSLSALAKDLIENHATGGAHNGTVDVRMLEDIIQVTGITDQVLRAQSTTVQDICTNLETKLNKSSFDGITEGISDGMKTKMAKVGINFDHLKKAFSEGGEDAPKLLLASDVDGRPRVTKNRKVLHGIITTIKNLVEKP